MFSLSPNRNSCWPSKRCLKGSCEMGVLSPASIPLMCFLSYFPLILYVLSVFQLSASELSDFQSYSRIFANVRNEAKFSMGGSTHSSISSSEPSLSSPSFFYFLPSPCKLQSCDSSWGIVGKFPQLLCQFFFILFLQINIKINKNYSIYYIQPKF